MRQSVKPIRHGNVRIGEQYAESWSSTWRATVAARAGTAAEGRDHRRRACSTASRRGRYATDASHYQIMPLGVVAPRTVDGGRARARARARGGRQRAAARRRHLAGRADGQRLAGHRLLEISRPRSRARRRAAGAAWSSPASCSTSSTASSSRTACGFRSTSRPPRAPPSAAWSATIPAARARCATATRARTCCSIDAVLADGTRGAFRPGRARSLRPAAGSPLRPLARDLLAIGAREADEIEARFPKVQRRVGGYNLDALAARPQRAQSRAYPGRLGRHARLLHRDRAEAFAAARPPRGRRLPFRQLPRGDGRRAAHRQARARSRSS